MHKLIKQLDQLAKSNEMLKQQIDLIFAQNIAIIESMEKSKNICDLCKKSNGNRYAYYERNYQSTSYFKGPIGVCLCDECANEERQKGDINKEFSTKCGHVYVRK